MTFEASSSGLSGGSRTITAFFDSRTDAEEAISELVAAGISRDQVRMVAGNEGGQSQTSSSSSYSSSNEMGFWDSLKDLFLPDEDRHVYAEGLHRGGYLVTVTASALNYDTALDILDNEGTIDINERESSWRSEGWTGYAGARSGGSSGLGMGTAGLGTGVGSGFGTGLASGSGSTRGMPSSGATGLAATDNDGTMAPSGMHSSESTTTTGFSSGTGAEEVIPVAEEHLAIGKRDVSHGRVRVRSYVVETPVQEQVSLREEHVSVQRRPADRALTGDEQLFQDRTIELEERGEEAVVAKEARIREELVINKEVNQRTETISDTVRRTEVDIEDDRGGSVSGTGGTLGGSGSGRI